MHCTRRVLSAPSNPMMFENTLALCSFLSVLSGDTFQFLKCCASVALSSTSTIQRSKSMKSTKSIVHLPSWPSRITDYSRLIVKVDRVDSQNSQVDCNRRPYQLRGLLVMQYSDTDINTAYSTCQSSSLLPLLQHYTTHCHILTILSPCYSRHSFTYIYNSWWHCVHVKTAESQSFYNNKHQTIKVTTILK